MNARSQLFLGPVLTMLSMAAEALGPAGMAQELPKWKQEQGYRVAPVQVTPSQKVGFTLLPGSETGVTFTNNLTQSRALANANLMNGSGVALGDFDGDGRCDIYLCDLGGTNVLYKNLGGWKFKDVTDEAGAACPNQTSTGAVFADVDGDGDLDLLVTSMGGPNACLINDGHGHFTNKTQEAGLVSKLGSTSMALADVDGNGTLDLYVANYGLTSIVRSGGALNLTYVNGQPVVRGRYAQRIKIINGMMFELGEPDVLYLNDGHGRFTPLSWTGGTFQDENGQPLTEVPWDQGLSVIFHDLNGDGFPDLYVCNDAFTPDRCWINDGHGRFKALNHLACRSTSYFSMGVDFADINRDGHDDFLVVDMLSRMHRFMLTQRGNMAPQPRLPGDIDSTVQSRRNTLFLNRGDGTYAEIAQYSGVAASEWTWGGTFIDVDLDGWEDVLVGNGFIFNMDDADVLNRIKGMRQLTVAESRRAVLLFPPLITPNVAFHNQRDLTFVEKGREWGFDSKAISNGKALADLDNDGDLDVVVNCLNSGALVYRNDTAAPRITVRLHGKSPNTQGIGAKIRVTGGPVTQTAEVMSGGRYMSGDDPVRMFAAGSARDLAIEVTWRSGARSVLPHCAPNHIYEIAETSAVLPDLSTEAAPTPALFEDATERLGHQHTEKLFDDFARQPLLPNRLSQLGPGAAWADLDGDRQDELAVASGQGGSLAVYRYSREKGFTRIDDPGLSVKADRDQTAVVVWPGKAGAASLLVGAASYEDGLTNAESVLQVELNGSKVQRRPGIPDLPCSVGPIAAADIDGDGIPELFVGGRVLPGRYPEPASSRIYRLRNGQWTPDEANSEALRNVGLVSGATWSDLDGDGFPELLLACEWGPLRIFANASGRFHDRTSEYGMASHVGWWTGVATGDLDGDGQMDIVAGNWGLNTPYHASPQHPVRLYYGDWKRTGGVDLLEAYDDPEMGIVPRRDFGAVAGALPFVRERYSSYMGFAEATVAQILGDRLTGSKELNATLLASMAFLNRGQRFEPVPLPAEAQFAPVFGVAVADFDGDGNEDTFLSQNFFATQAEILRYDSGRGLLLKGDGKGGFRALEGAESGILVYGEQRACAVCDYDQDGRLDLLVTQNGAATRLFHNARARPGLRVRLKGPETNPSGIGAQIRGVFAGRKGPARELRAGSGYWSQDSAVTVLTGSELPDEVWVRWPGGKTTLAKVRPGARELEVRWNSESR